MYRFHARDAAAIARLVAIEALVIGLLLAAFLAGEFLLLARVVEQPPIRAFEGDQERLGNDANRGE